MKELIERLKRTEYDDLDACKAADALERLTGERDAALAASRYETDLCQQALDTVKEVQAEVDRTIAERDALRADAERLNWMEDALKCYFFQIQSQPSGAYVVQGYGKKLRAAIDAAIAGEKT